MNRSMTLRGIFTGLTLAGAIVLTLPSTASARSAPWLLVGYNIDGTLRCLATACEPVFYLCCAGSEIE